MSTIYSITRSPNAVVCVAVGVPVGALFAKQRLRVVAGRTSLTGQFDGGGSGGIG